MPHCGHLSRIIRGGQHDPRDQRLSVLVAEELIWSRAKHLALLRSDTRKFNQALGELARIKTAIFAEGPASTQREADNA